MAVQWRLEKNKRKTAGRLRGPGWLTEKGMICDVRQKYDPLNNEIQNWNGIEEIKFSPGVLFLLNFQSLLNVSKFWTQWRVGELSSGP